MSQSLLNDLPRGDPVKKQIGSPPGEAFTRTEDIAASQTMAFKPGKIFLGLVQAEITGKITDLTATGGLPIGVSDNRHMVTIAGTRSGKGRSVIIPNMLTYPGSVLATDPKGELATITARHRSKGLKQNVYVLDPFRETKGSAKGLRKNFNAIRAMRQTNLVEDASLIADALVVVPPNTKDPHWDEAARAFIEGLILYVRTEEEYKKTGSLATVRRLAGVGEPGPNGEPSSLGALKIRMINSDALNSKDKAMQAVGAVITAAATDFFERPPNEKGSVLSNVRRQLKFLDYPEIAESVSGHDFDLAELKLNPTTVYLCIPARHIGTCRRWLRMFVNLALRAMEVGGIDPGALPVVFCLDEFASLGYMAQIEDAAGQIAGFGVKLWPILQDLSQLKALYDDRWETFLGNAGVIQFFGNNDLTTLEWIAKRCGTTSIRTREDSAVTGSQSDSGMSGGDVENRSHGSDNPRRSGADIQPVRPSDAPACDLGGVPAHHPAKGAL